MRDLRQPLAKQMNLLEKRIESKAGHTLFRTFARLVGESTEKTIRMTLLSP
jgi:hypothetical protein